MGLVQTFVFRQTLGRKQELVLAHAPTQSGRVPFTSQYPNGGIWKVSGYGIISLMRSRTVCLMIRVHRSYLCGGVCGGSSSASPPRREDHAARRMIFATVAKFHTLPVRVVTPSAFNASEILRLEIPCFAAERMRFNVSTSCANTPYGFLPSHR